MGSRFDFLWHCPQPKKGQVRLAATNIWARGLDNLRRVATCPYEIHTYIRSEFSPEITDIQEKRIRQMTVELLPFITNRNRVDRLCFMQLSNIDNEIFASTALQPAVQNF